MKLWGGRGKAWGLREVMEGLGYVGAMGGRGGMGGYGGGSRGVVGNGDSLGGAIGARGHSADPLPPSAPPQTSNTA